MKKAISVLLALLMVLSCSTVAFAGSWVEANNLESSDIVIYCTACGSEKSGGKCTGKFGCNCCEACPGYIDDTGVALNCTQFCGCRYDVFYDIDVFDKTTGELLHKGTQKNVYYWKPVCCEKCTGVVGCKCNDVTDDKDGCSCSFCAFTPDKTEEMLQEGLEKGRTSFTGAIQNVLIILRDLMYDLFNSLFEFLRIDVILGPDRVPKESV